MRKLLLALGLFSTLTPFAVANAAGCTGTLATTGSYFQNYENIEYSPDGLLIIRFRTTSSSTQRTISADWLVRNDECDQGNVTSGSSDRDIIIPKGSSDFSIRFSSPTHYDIWNDASSTSLTCPGLFPAQQGCSVDIPDYPDYYTFGWKALQQNPTGGPVSTLQTSYHPIHIPATVAPVLTETLPTPEACVVHEFKFGSGYFFDNYERAEYVDGLLRIHYRIRSPYNDG